MSQVWVCVLQQKEKAKFFFYFFRQHVSHTKILLHYFWHLSVKTTSYSKAGCLVFIFFSLSNPYHCFKPCTQTDKHIHTHTLPTLHRWTTALCTKPLHSSGRQKTSWLGSKRLWYKDIIVTAWIQERRFCFCGAGGGSSRKASESHVVSNKSQKKTWKETWEKMHMGQILCKGQWPEVAYKFFTILVLRHLFYTHDTKTNFDFLVFSVLYMLWVSS